MKMQSAPTVSTLAVRQEEAYRRVEFFLAAVGEMRNGSGTARKLSMRDLYRQFSRFALLAGWNGEMYRQVSGGDCPAVNIYLNKNSHTLLAGQFVVLPDESGRRRIIDRCPEREEWWHIVRKVFHY